MGSAALRAIASPIPRLPPDTTSLRSMNDDWPGMPLLGCATALMVVAFSFYASGIIAVYRAFGHCLRVDAGVSWCMFPVCGIGILIFCKYVIQ